jgi:predicted metalloprotease with PDZ domain
MKETPRNWLGPVLLLLVCLHHVPLHTQTTDAGTTRLPRYTISFANYQDHRLRVRFELPAGASHRLVQLPVWNALYQVRDFSQYIDRVIASTPAGVSLAVRKTDKSSWEIDGAETGAAIEYDIVADDPGPYGAEINSNHAFLNLAQILMYSSESRDCKAQVQITNVPPDWKFATPLANVGNGFEAPNYDTLVDSPIEAGTFREADFDEGGGHYRVVVDAESGDYDMNRITENVHKIVAAATGWMQDRPFQTYVFLYHFPHAPSGGGMEHAYSTAIDVNAQLMRDDLQSFNGVTAHEFFHLWNVKRIRPQSLEPIDYSRENYTRALWFSEGVTSTAEEVILLRAGLLDERGYLQKISAEITELQRRPAHTTQSAEESSLDAWLEKYAEYRLPERSISYYNKGELLGTMLDLALRKATHDATSLRDVFQWMNDNYAKKKQFFPDSTGVRTAAETVSHQDLGSFFDQYVSGTKEIPWDEFFSTVGLHVIRSVTTVADPGFVAIHNFDAPAAVVRLQPGSDAEKAGLMAGDIVLELDGRPVAADFERRLRSLRPGDLIRLRVRQRGKERDLQWKVGSREEPEYELKDLDKITPEQRVCRAAWLKGESQSAGGSRP